MSKAQRSELLRSSELLDEPVFLSGIITTENIFFAAMPLLQIPDGCNRRQGHCQFKLCFCRSFCVHIGLGIFSGLMSEKSWGYAILSRGYSYFS
ncbi:MAG: hypothetical protein L3J26_09560 [Candidatus Polarisedimenticolaceae bacterium]|nr:hypothetical protein [Candidatus Polarisedimenticolaceae bacterium]